MRRQPKEEPLHGREIPKGEVVDSQRRLKRLLKLKDGSVKGPTNKGRQIVKIRDCQRTQRAGRTPEKAS